MPKKLKVVEITEEPLTYDDVVKDVETVVEEEPSSSASIEEEPPTLKPTKPVKTKKVSSSSTPIEEEPPTIEPVEAVRMKKASPMGTCEGCGKTMTVKNLKYAHMFVCSAMQTSVVDDTPPPMPKLERTTCVIVEPSPVKKTTSKVKAEKSAETQPEKTKAKRQPEKSAEPQPDKPKAKRQPRKSAEPLEHSLNDVHTAPIVPRKATAVLKAELYGNLVANAL